MTKLFKKFAGGSLLTLVLSATSTARASEAPAASIDDQATQQKVAVIFNGGDAKVKDLSDALAAREQELARLYRSNGYRVVVLSPADDTNKRKSFEASIKALKNVSDLQVLFVGHGDVGPTNVLTDRNQFSMTSLTSKEFAASLGPDRGLEHSFTIKGQGSRSEEGIGINGLRKSLKDFQSKNPSANTTIMALNCFSGHLAIELSDLPRLQVYTATGANSVATTCRKTTDMPSKDGVDFIKGMTKNLCSGKNFMNAQKASSREYFDYCKDAAPDKIEYFPVPLTVAMQARNSAQGYVDSWCKNATPSSSPPVAADATFEKRVRSMTSDFYHDEASSLQELEKKFCNPDLIHDLEETNSTQKRAIWAKAKEKLLNDDLMRVSSADELRKKTEEMQKELDSFRALVSSKPSTDPAYAPMANDLKTKEMMIQSFKQAQQDPQTYREALKHTVDDLDHCLGVTDMDVSLCAEEIVPVMNIFDPYSVRDQDERILKDPCVSKYQLPDKKTALKEFFQCRLTNSQTTGLLLDALRFPSPKKACLKLMANIDLNKMGLMCVDSFLKHATPAQRSHLSAMIALSEKSFSGVCTNTEPAMVSRPTAQGKAKQ